MTNVRTRISIIESAIATIEIELAYMKGALDGLMKDLKIDEVEK